MTRALKDEMESADTLFSGFSQEKAHVYRR
jgi:hypothetical protein